MTQDEIWEVLKSKGVTYKPTPEQFKIFEWVTGGSGNLMIRAVAGSGKSSSLIACSKLLPPSTNAAFIAFSNTIVNELKTRLAGTPVRATTIHSAGRTALCKRIRYPKLEPTKYRDIAKSIITQEGIRWADVADLFPYLTAASKLCEKARLTLTDVNSAAALTALSVQFNIDLPKLYKRTADGDDIEYDDPRVFQLVAQMIPQGALIAQRAAMIDFTDMIWLPVFWNIAPDPVDVLMIDECQDLSNLSRAFLKLWLTHKTRAIAVGDPFQSIMSFAGASNNSYNEVKEVLKATELPLNWCFRCGTSFVEMAKTYVPYIEAAPGAIPGEIRYDTEDRIASIAERGDLIICRRTAPLIENCIKLIGAGIPARVRGRDVAGQLVDLMNKIGRGRGFKADQFLEFMQDYRQVQVDKMSQEDDSEDRIQSLRDKCECLKAIYLRHLPPTLNAFKDSIEALFADEDANPPIWLSSIHRAKGLEADRVMVIGYDTLPAKFKNQSAEQAEQERNITYVALTRAKKVMILIVETVPAPVVESDVIDAEIVPDEKIAAPVQLALPGRVETLEAAIVTALAGMGASCGDSAIDNDRRACPVCKNCCKSAFISTGETPAKPTGTVIHSTDWHIWRCETCKLVYVDPRKWRYEGDGEMRPLLDVEGRKVIVFHYEEWYASDVLLANSIVSRFKGGSLVKMTESDIVPLIGSDVIELDYNDGGYMPDDYAREMWGGEFHYPDE